MIWRNVIHTKYKSHVVIIPESLGRMMVHTCILDSVEMPAVLIICVALPCPLTCGKTIKCIRDTLSRNALLAVL